MKKYVLIGASSRCQEMFSKPIVEEYGDVAKIAGIFDINRTRAEYISKDTGMDIPVYSDFDAMMQETRPDAAIITTIDRYHHEYIIKVLEYGCDAITEKPMTIDDEKCRAILEAEKRTGRKVIVTFNFRYSPYVTRIKELLNDGAVGKILSVNYEFMLDTIHGAEYFRRWHRRKENSGGLLVHKSTHCFDAVNWWIDEDPEEVYANGTTRFYGPVREKKGIRCSTCSFSKSCEFAVKYNEDKFMNDFYFKAEKEDGYIRDACLFSEEIDIEDSMSVMVKYSKGTILTYSLIAYSPYEGWKLSVNGTGGRLEAEEFATGQKAGDSFQRIRVFDMSGEMAEYTMSKANGNHGGGDDRLRRMLFSGDVPDPLGHFADSFAGAKSIMIGICANKSMKEKRPVCVKDLLKLAEYTAI